MTEPLTFANSIVLLSESKEYRQETLRDLQSESLAAGLKVNMNKSNAMLNKHAASAFFSLGDEKLEQVDTHNYVEKVVSADLSHKKETWRRISMGWGALG